MEFQGSVKKINYYNQENGYGIVRVEVSNETMNRIIQEIEDDLKRIKEKLAGVFGK